MSGTQADESRSSDSSIIHVPPITPSHPLLRSLPPMTQLPADLLDLLNQAYFLHLLANDPSKVLPAGKSLLSVMSRPHLRRRGDDEVEEMVHKAFWDEALQSLSSREPSIQLPRLKLLVNYSHDILVALRRRCAPARDAYIDTLPCTIRSLLTLAETMKDDLSQFVLGSMGEVQLSATIADQARLQERALFIQEDITTWIADLSQPYTLWVLRLVQALGGTDPVTCPLPTKPLTPQDGAHSPLLYIQNFLQAIVIAAALRALLPTENGAEDARLVNLADELVRASSMVDDEAGKLRAAVARTLRATDPVFLLLQRRLLSALAERLARAPAAPTTLNVTSEEQTEAEVLDFKGFGDPVLTGAIQEGLKKLRVAVRWIESIWADALEPRSVANGIDEQRQR
ncbi:hypothetical protein H4582DRAFT_1927948 [Lactarius indigo]|nr:hypothetical protein H4582DRAFT_1927948 [Lactarius indigo]